MNTGSLMDPVNRRPSGSGTPARSDATHNIRAIHYAHKTNPYMKIERHEDTKLNVTHDPHETQLQTHEIDPIQVHENSVTK